MGNNNSKKICENLNEYVDACRMHECVINVNGLKSNSASPTDTWIVTFKDDTKYNNEPLNKAFIKWYMSPSSLKYYQTNNGKNELSSTYSNGIYGLEYELNVYRKIIRPIIDQGICPNFIRYLGSGVRCSYNDLLNILKNGSDINEKILNKNLTRNILFILNKKRKRPSILMETEINNKWDYVNNINSNTQYNLIVNEVISKDTRTFSNILDNEMPNGEILEETWKIIFQIVVACYTMSLSKMVHNDLHTSNIYVEKIQPTKITYIINNKSYTFITENKAMIYDFDRAYVESLGENIKVENENELCTSNSQCNIFISNKDMMKFFSYVYKDSNKNMKKKIVNILGKNEESKKRINKVYNSDNGYWLRDDSENIWTDEIYKTFNTAEKILENVIKNVKL
jgi:hypothetical protein